jgi:nucleoside 2-deoxyribosyltransferase
MMVYLAGPVTGLTYAEAVGWRSAAASYLRQHGITALSPLRGTHFLADLGVLRDQYLDTHPLVSARAITAQDRWDCQRADIILVHLLGAERVSIGTVLELAWADAAGKPIVAVMEASGNPHDHPMIRELIGWRLEALQPALEMIVTLAGDDPTATVHKSQGDKS